MANPFYIPAGPSIGERVAQPLTELMRIRQAGQLGEEHNRLMGEDIALRTQALDQGKATLAETQRANRAKEPLSRQNFGPEEKKAFMETIKQIDPEGAFKFLDKATEAMVKNPKADKGYLFGHLLNNWDTFYNPQAIRSVNEILANPEVDPATKDYYQEILKALQSPNSAKVLDKLMPNVAREYQMENLKLASEFPAQSGYKPMTREEWMADETLKAGLRPKGLNIEFDESGKPTRITQGDVSSIPNMQKPTAGKVEEGLFNIQDNLARLDEIQQSYRPEFLELGTKWNAYKTAWGEKLKGTKLGEVANALIGTDMDPADKQLLADYSAFKRDAINNINLYIKVITGAAMAEKEANRIRKGMPDPGEGLFDGDSPTEFEAKWKSATKSLRSAQARYIIYLKQGLSPELIKKMVNNGTAMSLMEVNNKINEKARDMEKDGMPPDVIRKELKRLFFTMEQ